MGKSFSPVFLTLGTLKKCTWKVSRAFKQIIIAKASKRRKLFGYPKLFQPETLGVIRVYLPNDSTFGNAKGQFGI